MQSVDEFGNIWFGKPPCCPAIFPSKRLEQGRVVHNGAWFVSMGSDKGCVFIRGQLRYFATQKKAEDVLRGLVKIT